MLSRRRALRRTAAPADRFVAENLSLNAAYEAGRAAWRAGCVLLFAELEAARARALAESDAVTPPPSPRQGQGEATDSLREALPHG